MKTKITIFAILCLPFLLPAFSAGPGGAQDKDSYFTVIINPAAGIQGMNREELRSVLLGKAKRFHTIALQRQHKTEILNLYGQVGVREFDRIWERLIATGVRNREPVYSRSAKSLAKFVSRNQGALAIVDWSPIGHPPETLGVIAIVIHRDSGQLNDALINTPPAVSSRILHKIPVQKENERDIEHIYKGSTDLQIPSNQKPFQVPSKIQEMKTAKTAETKGEHKGRFTEGSTRFTKTTSEGYPDREKTRVKRSKNAENGKVNIRREFAPSVKSARSLPPSSGKNKEKRHAKPKMHNHSKADVHYEDAMLALKQRHFYKVRDEIEAIKEIAPDYPDLDGLVATLEEELLIEARLRELKSINRLWPGGGRAQDKAKGLVINDESKKSVPKNLDAKSTEANLRVGILGTALATILAFPILGLALSSRLRAEAYLLVGANTKAMHIYEKMLLEHPERIKLYLKLADIYLLLGRQDDTAIKIFMAVLRLRLSTPNIAYIRSMVANSHWQSQV